MVDIPLLTRKIGALLGMLRTILVYRWRFGKMGPRCVIERPYRLLGARHMVLGRNVRIRAGARLEAFSAEGHVANRPYLNIGDNVSIGQGAHISCTQAIMIGHGSLLGARVTVVDSDHGVATAQPRDRSPVVCAPVVIGERVWIGNNAVVTSGVTIGDSATVGANAVVTHDVAPGDIVGGVPARSLSRRSSES